MNIVDINTNKLEEVKERPGFLKICYTDGSDEILQIDSFGISEDLPGYITAWSESKEGVIGFFNNSSIKKILLVDGPREVMP